MNKINCNLQIVRFYIVNLGKFLRLAIFLKNKKTADLFGNLNKLPQTALKHRGLKQQKGGFRTALVNLIFRFVLNYRCMRIFLCRGNCVCPCQRISDIKNLEETFFSNPLFSLLDYFQATYSEKSPLVFGSLSSGISSF